MYNHSLALVMYNNGNINNYFNKPIVLIVCEIFTLTVFLAEKFSNNNLFVVIVSKNTKRLKKHFSTDKNVLIEEKFEFIYRLFPRVDYFIYFKNSKILGVKDRSILIEEIKKEILIYKRFVIRYKPKSLFLIYGLHNEVGLENNKYNFNELFKTVKKYGALVYYGDLLSKEYQENYLSYLHAILVLTKINKKVLLNPKQFFYPILEDDLSEKIFDLLFSLRAYGKSFFITGRPLNIKTLSKIIENNRLNLNINTDRFLLFDYDESITLKKQSKKFVWQVFKYLKKSKPEHSISLFNMNNERKIFFKSIFFMLLKNISNCFVSYRLIQKNMLKLLVKNKLKLSVTTVILIFILPILLNLFSISFLFFTKLAYDQNLIEISLSSAKTSSFISKYNYNYSIFLNKIPLTRKYFSFFEKSSSILMLQSNSAVMGLGLLKSYSMVFRKTVLGDKFEIDKFLLKITLDIEELYQKLGFLESEIAGLQGFGISIANIFVNEIDLSAARQKLLVLKQMNENLPSLLGQEKPVNYVLVFQDNSFLKPTGGRIESLSIIGLSGSKINEVTTEDVSWFDNKLVGRVEPPDILKKYFDINAWYLKDSNWDPDFSYSASQIEFFLDKQINISPDVIISLNKDFAYQLLEKLDNRRYSKKILDELYYENKTAENYPKDVKESSLTNILKNVISEKFVLDESKSNILLKELVKGLNNKDVQVFTNNTDLQNELSILDWDGSFSVKGCSMECFPEFISIIESVKAGDSLGVSREAQLTFYFQEKILKRKLTFYLENKNNTVYKSYMRLFTNSDAGFSPINVVGRENNYNLNPEIRSARGLKEAGLFLEIQPWQTLAIVYIWESPFELDFFNKGEFRLFWRRQSGVKEYPLEITVFLPENAIVFTNPEYSLTERGVLRYNASLDKDFNTRIFW